jgi:hypothetical protein
MGIKNELQISEENHLDHQSASQETPLRADAFDISDADKIDSITQDVERIMNTLGLDLTDDSLKDTPKRVAKMFVSEIFGGLQKDKKPKDKNKQTNKSGKTKGNQTTTKQQQQNNKKQETKDRKNKFLVP